MVWFYCDDCGDSIKKVADGCRRRLARTSTTPLTAQASKPLFVMLCVQFHVHRLQSNI